MQAIAVVGAAVLALWTLHRIPSVVLVLIAGALVAYVMAPMVQLVERAIRLGGRTRRLPRAAAIGVVYLLVAVGLCAGAMLLLPIASRQAAEAVARFPAYAQATLEWEHGWSRYYERLRLPLELRRWIDESAAATGETALVSVRQSIQAVAGSVSLLPALVLVPVLAFFLLKDAGDIRRIVVIALPFRFRLRGHRLFEALNATLAAYVRAQLLACALVGAVCGVGFAVIGLPYAVLLGVLAGAELDGVAGMFLAVPAVAVATVVCRHGLMWRSSGAAAPAAAQTGTLRPVAGWRPRSSRN